MIVIVIIFGIIIVGSLIYSAYIEEKKESDVINLNKEFQIIKEDFKNIQFDFIVEEDSINYVNKNLQFILKALQDSRDEKSLTHIYDLFEEQINNLNVITQESKMMNPIECNLLSKIKYLISDLQKQNKIKVEFSADPKLDNILCFDYIKLLSALRLIILKSSENGIKKIEIIIKLIKRKYNAVDISLEIKNIKLLSDASDITKDEFYSFMNITCLGLNRTEGNIDPELLIIRQNLVNIASNISFSEIKNSYNMSIVFRSKILDKKKVK